MGTQRSYVDKCVLCGRELVGNGTKCFISAEELRSVLKEYNGPGEFICCSLEKCGRRVDNNLIQRLRQRT